MRSFFFFGLILLVATAVSGSLWGQSSRDTAWMWAGQFGGFTLSSDNKDIVEPGDTISPKTKLPLRASPPGGMFGLKGKFVGLAEPSIVYKVKEEKDINSFVGSQKWMKVQAIYGPSNSQEGWIFTGYSGENPDQNVVIVPK
jgi:hypothetical protein